MGNDEFNLGKLTVMRRLLLPSLLLAVSAASLTACSNDRLLNGTPTPVFQQIDRVGRPGIVELFSPYAGHGAFNSSAPSGDTGTIGAAIATFMTGTAGRSAATSSAAQTLLTPDVLIADLSKPGPASYLGIESAGRINGTSGTVASGGGLFGGRALTDDAVTANLSIAFGSTLSLLGLAADDGNESDGRSGRPTLTSDFVTTGSRTFSGTFPYLGAPH